MKVNSITTKFRKMPWSTLNNFLKSIGWEQQVDRKNLKRYKIGSKTLVIINVGKNKWKVDYFIGRRLVDSAGVMDEEFAKVMAGELGWLRGIN